MEPKKQVYDAEGTTHFSFTLKVVENGKTKQWMLHFSQGFMSIFCPSTGLHFRMTFPYEEHWQYEYTQGVLRHGAVERGAIMRTSKFVLKADVREYIDPYDISPHDEDNIPGEHEGHLDLRSDSMAISVEIPYKVALAIMIFASGSTDIPEARYVTKSSG